MRSLGWAIVMMSVGWLGCGVGPEGGRGVGDADASASDLSQAEIDSLVFTREEEKVARDVYDALDGYGQPFVNIQRSEQRHMDAVETLLDRYDLADPVEGRGIGELANPELQALHDGLVAQGELGQREALAVGCEIEELDLRDLATAKQDVQHEDILATYDTLMLGSRNHLRAFHGRLVAAGGTYSPKYLDQATFDAIVSSSNEKP